MVIWSTKYCLTEGITKHDVKDTDESSVVIPRTKDAPMLMLHGLGREWHKTEEGAIKRATEIKAKKIISLNKQIKKVSLIEF